MFGQTLDVGKSCYRFVRDPFLNVNSVEKQNKTSKHTKRENLK